MPIHLIIDGYNLLGVRGGLRGDVEARREQLIRDLAGYRQRKGHPVTVVFDGWRAGHPVEHVEWREGIGVVYSRRSEEHTSELQSRLHLVCRLLLEKKKK